MPFFFPLLFLGGSAPIPALSELLPENLVPPRTLQAIRPAYTPEHCLSEEVQRQLCMLKEEYTVCETYFRPENEYTMEESCESEFEKVSDFLFEHLPEERSWIVEQGYVRDFLALAPASLVIECLEIVVTQALKTVPDKHEAFPAHETWLPDLMRGIKIILQEHSSVWSQIRPWLEFHLKNHNPPSKYFEFSFWELKFNPNRRKTEFFSYFLEELPKLIQFCKDRRHIPFPLYEQKLQEKMKQLKKRKSDTSNKILFEAADAAIVSRYSKDAAFGDEKKAQPSGMKLLSIPHTA